MNYIIVILASSTVPIVKLRVSLVSLYFVVIVLFVVTSIVQSHHQKLENQRNGNAKNALMLKRDLSVLSVVEWTKVFKNFVIIIESIRY